MSFNASIGDASICTVLWYHKFKDAVVVDNSVTSSLLDSVYLPQTSSYLDGLLVLGVICAQNNASSIENNNSISLLFCYWPMYAIMLTMAFAS